MKESSCSGHAVQPPDHPAESRSQRTTLLGRRFMRSCPLRRDCNRQPPQSSVGFAGLLLLQVTLGLSVVHEGSEALQFLRRLGQGSLLGRCSAKHSPSARTRLSCAITSAWLLLPSAITWVMSCFPALSPPSRDSAVRSSSATTRRTLQIATASALPSAWSFTISF